jgi:hypothetical protein
MVRRNPRIKAVSRKHPEPSGAGFQRTPEKY